MVQCIKTDFWSKFGFIYIIIISKLWLKYKLFPAVFCTFMQANVMILPKLSDDNFFGTFFILSFIIQAKFRP